MRARLFARPEGRPAKADREAQVKPIAPRAQVLSDVTSRLNFERKSFKKLIERTRSRDASRVYITHGDRLVTFGFDLIEQTYQLNDTKAIITDGEPMLTAQEETARNLISIITSFSK